MKVETESFGVIWKAGRKGVDPKSFGHYDEFWKAKQSLPEGITDNDYKGGPNGFTEYPDGYYIVKIKVY